MSNEIIIEKKGSSLFLHNIQEKPIKIPSQMYPLTGQMEVATAKNTTPFPADERTETVRRVFDSIRPEVGRCYSNSKRLLSALHEAGIKEAEAYVGWVIFGGAMPVHHCFVAIEDKVLDLTERPSLLLDEATFANVDNIDEARKLLAENVLKLQALPNSEKATFGQADPYALYIACPCAPDAGLKVYQKLMKAFPKHPAYTNIDANGSNKTQDIIRKAKGEEIHR